MPSIKKQVLILLMLISSFSCQKQSAPIVNPEDAWQIRDQARLEACSKVNFTQNLLLHKNTFHLFKCAGWDKKFPSLNRGIQNISPVSWNHFFKPIDDVFLNDKQRRDRVFDHVRDLDSKRGLDDLSRVITALNETNFYDGIRDIFICAEDRNNPKCDKRNGKELSKAEVKNLIKLVELKPVSIKSLAILVNEIMAAIGDDSEDLRSEIKKFFYDDKFIEARLRLVSSVAQKFNQGLTPIERQFYKKIPITRWRDNDEPYLYTWIQKPSFTNALFRRLTNYAVIENPEVIKDLKLLKRGYHYPVYCKPYSKDGKIDIDLKTHVDDFLNFVYENEYEPFHDYVLQSTASLQLAVTFCPKLKNYSGNIVYVENGEVVRGKHSLNFVELEKKLVDLTSELPIFDISKFITFLASRNLGDIPPNPGFLLDIATEEAAEWMIEIIKTIHASSDIYFDLTYKMMKKMRPMVFDSVGVLSNEFLSTENDKKIKALSKAWLFFDKEEQNFLFNYMDRHLHDDTNFMLLFKFYTTMLEEYATVSPVFSDFWTSSEEALEDSYRALFDIVNNFSGENVLRDFDKFFSREHIITIMKVVTRGPELRRVALNRLDASIVSRYLAKIPTRSFDISFTEADTDYSRRAKKCIDGLTNGKTIYYILSNFPKECEYFKHKEITLQTFSWLAQIQNDFEKFFGIPAGGPTLLDDKGLLAPDVLNNSMALLRLIDENLSYRIEGDRNTGGIKYLMDVAQKHLYQITNQGMDGFIKDVVNLTDLAAIYLETGGVEHRYLRNKKLLEVISDDGPKAEELLLITSDLLDDYSKGLDEGKYEPEEYVEDVKYSCASYVNHNIGGIPCPSKERIKRGIKSVFSDLVQEYGEEGEATAIGYFIQALVPGRGLQIPYKSKEQRLKRLTVKESAEMVYKLTDISHPKNNLDIEFSEDDEYDLSYDVSNWSGLKKKNKSNESLDIDEMEEHVKPEDEIEYKGRRVRMNTLERVEITMRDVRFDMNYLGAHYKNAVAEADDYNKTVSKKLSMFKKCVGARFCGKFFSKQQVRMGKNAVKAYPGLLDANEVKEFGFGDYMQTLLGALVRGSSKKSRKTALVRIKIFGKKLEIPWVQTKKQLREHNGKVLSKLSMLSGFSNFSRVVRDRIGRTPKAFNENLKSQKMKILDELLLSGVDPIATEIEVIKILKTLSGESVTSATLVDNVVSWISTLNYQEQREFEDFLVNSAVSASFLGVSAQKLDYTLSSKKIDRYKDNNLGDLIAIGASILPILKNFENIWPTSISMIDIIRMANKPLKFVTEELSEVKDLDRNNSYKLINEIYLLVKKFLNEETEFSEKGSYYLASYLNKSENAKSLMKGLVSLVNYVEYFETKNIANKSGIKVFSENIKAIVSDKRFSVDNLRKYILMSTSTKQCVGEFGPDCENNVHYDEPARLLVFSAQKSGSSTTNIEKLLDTLFKDYINDYTDMVDHLLPLIRIKLNN